MKDMNWLLGTSSLTSDRKSRLAFGCWMKSPRVAGRKKHRNSMKAFLEKIECLEVGYHFKTDHMAVEPKIGVGTQNGGFIMEIPIKIHDLGVPLFLETPIYGSYMFNGIFSSDRLILSHIVRDNGHNSVRSPLIYSNAYNRGHYITNLREIPQNHQRF